MKLLISACLLGISCRYDGKTMGLDADRIRELNTKFELVPVCPEVFGGLATPRKPCELCGGQVLTEDGDNLTPSYVHGAEEALKLAEMLDCKTALLKANSPSCGSGTIYDGTFSHTVIVGNGITARLLKEHGITVYTEQQIDEILSLS